MKNKLLLALCALIACWIGYLASQSPSLFWSRHLIALSLKRGHYRSWVVEFYEGEFWPHFRYTDTRRLHYTNDTLIKP